MISLDEFKKIEKPKRRSKLEPFKDDIFNLRNDGYSEVSIVKYLAMNGVTVSQRGVNLFVNSHLAKEQKEKIDSVKEVPEEKKPIKEFTSPKPRQFDWQSKVDRSELICFAYNVT